MAPHKDARPLPLAKELWASLIQCIRHGIMIAYERASNNGERNDANAAIEAVEAIDSITPERCLHCAIRDMLIAHAEAHGQDMLNTARAEGWNPRDPTHATAQSLILRARLVALGTVAGELVTGHKPYSSSPWPDLIMATSDTMNRAFSEGLNEEADSPTPPEEPACPPSSRMSDLMDGLRPPKSKLH